MPIPLLLTLFLSSLLAGLADRGRAESNHRAEARTPHASVALLSEQATAAPRSTNWLGLRFRLDPGWHIYWRNPGDSGYPPRITWDLPEGVTAGEILWPTPERLPVGPLTNFGYTGEVILASPITLPTDYAGLHLPVVATVRWLVCADVCIPESATLALTLPVAAAASPDPQYADTFARTRARWPLASPPAGWTISALPRQGGVRLQFETPPGVVISAANFFPFGEGLMDAAAAQVLRRDGQQHELDLSVAEVPLAPWERVSGIVVARLAGAKPATPAAFVVDQPLTGAAAAAPDSPAAESQRSTTVDASLDSPPTDSLPLLVAALLAFVGGALLNLMPCVFPVLSIKLLALVRNEHQGIPAGRHALLYSIGVISAFVALAVLLLVLRAAGASLGWGFHLQSPAVVASLALLFFALALSLSGALPIGSLADDVPGTWRLRHPEFDALASGGLAVLVASPCTAPLMGAALGAALTMPTGGTLLVFVALGLGMALPFALLVRYPLLSCWLPRPGPWMVRLKEFLALPLYGTVVWLTWVLAEQIGSSAVISVGGGVVAIGLLAWARRLAGGWLRRCAVALALASALGAAIWPGLPGRDGRSRETDAAWQAWTPEAFASARTTQRLIFVDFTAAWCVTCQVNKRLVLERAEVLAAFAASGTLLMRGDWTRHDPTITAELARLGRSGVPVYAFFPPQGEARLLPEILTPGVVIETLRPFFRAPGHS
ncbi:protein-disulfide reductase DsbD domain-containing protein [Accumulibacter sp.]|uniref:protein-disulfide reductase DsbD family protein n=1 Tax=Accumulibacter sp. TaxID=2053492 RepID=UPI0025E19560|nr:protein-disulfide reductase DsbD domain-containing protein [Accumulibacter sp.]MCM8626624.1 thioredoxin family protein [Accumulibacter sp.]